MVLWERSREADGSLCLRGAEAETGYTRRSSTFRPPASNAAKTAPGTLLRLNVIPCLIL